MNLPKLMALSYDLIRKVEDEVRPRYESLGDNWAHGWTHISRGAKTAEKLARRVGADPVACRIAFYCHDLGVFQEKNGGDQRPPGNTNHALWAVEPTIAVLQNQGIIGYDQGAIVAAVANHSFRDYQGRDLIGSVLRDADKSEALGPYGTLRCSRHVYGEDITGTDKVLRNLEEPTGIINLAFATLDQIKQRPDKIKYLNNLNFILEWDELRMFHHPEVYDLVRDDLEYTRMERWNLVESELVASIEQSRSDPRRRKAFFFHKPEYERTQFGINAIQTDSMVRPHARSTPESIIHLAGELVYIEFDHNGRETKRGVLNDTNRHIRVPARTFHTVYATKPDSALGMLVPGPHRPSDFRIDADWAPLELPDNALWYHELKTS